MDLDFGLENTDSVQCTKVHSGTITKMDFRLVCFGPKNFGAPAMLVRSAVQVQSLLIPVSHKKLPLLSKIFNMQILLEMLGLVLGSSKLELVLY